MTGVAALGPGKSVRHRASSFDHADGNPFSVEEPLKCGPRHWGQSSAPIGPQFRRIAAPATNGKRLDRAFTTAMVYPSFETGKLFWWCVLPYATRERMQ